MQPQSDIFRRFLKTPNYVINFKIWPTTLYVEVICETEPLKSQGVNINEKIQTHEPVGCCPEV